MMEKSVKGGRKSQKQGGNFFFFWMIMSPSKFFCFPWTLHSHSSWLSNLPDSVQTHSRWTKVSIPILESLFFSMRLSYKREKKNRASAMLKMKKITSCPMSGRISEALTPTGLSLFWLSSSKLIHIHYDSYTRNKQHLLWLVHVNAWVDWNRRKCIMAI